MICAVYQPRPDAPAWICFACGYESHDMGELERACPRCGKRPGWTGRPRESLRARRLYRLREAGRLTREQCAALFRSLLQRAAAPQKLEWQPEGCGR